VKIEADKAKPLIVDELTPAARALIGRAGGASLFGDVLPLIANFNAASPLPTELLGDALLSVHDDWWTAIRNRQVVGLAVRLEKANAAIIERYEQEAAAEAAARPTRKGTRKATAVAGRR
jgi:hypothetical protein